MFWLSSPQISLKKFIGSCEYLGIVLIFLWRELCSWCLLTFRGCGSVPGSWAPRRCRHNFIVAVLEYLSFADIENLFYAVVGEITSTSPSTGEFGSIAIARVTDAFRRLRYTISGVFLGYVLTDGYSLDVGIVSFGWDIYCFPYIPNTRLHNQKVLGVL